jgi:hypothetical protein
LIKNGGGTLTVSNVSQGTVNLSAGKMNVVSGGSVYASGTFTGGSGATLGLAAASSAVITANSAVISGLTLVVSPGSALNNVSRYDGTDADAGKILIHTSSGITGDFQANVSGATGLRPFLYADVWKYENDLLAGMGLVWEMTSGAHGTFYLDTNDTFTLGASLTKNSANSASFVGGWDSETLTKLGDGLLTVTSAISRWDAKRLTDSFPRRAMLRQGLLRPLEEVALHPHFRDLSRTLHREPHHVARLPTEFHSDQMNGLIQ